MKNSADQKGCYPPRPNAEVDNTIRDLQNPILGKLNSIIALLFIQNIFKLFKEKKSSLFFSSQQKEKHNLAPRFNNLQRAAL